MSTDMLMGFTLLYLLYRAENRHRNTLFIHDWVAEGNDLLYIYILKGAPPTVFYSRSVSEFIGRSEQLIEGGCQCAGPVQFRSRAKQQLTADENFLSSVFPLLSSRKNRVPGGALMKVGEKSNERKFFLIATSKCDYNT